MTRWLVKVGLLLFLLPEATTSLQLPSLTSSPPTNELSRRSAVSLLITSSSAAISSTTCTLPLASAAGGAEKAGYVASQVLLNSNNKKAFPLASFGLQIYDDDTAYRLTLMALEVGYRNFFASVLAGNQKGFAKVRSFYLFYL